MKPALCKLGFHKQDKTMYLLVKKRSRFGKWHKNYVICERCGKRLFSFAIQKMRRDHED